MKRTLLLLAMALCAASLWAQNDAPQSLPEAPSVTRFPGGTPQKTQSTPKTAEPLPSTSSSTQTATQDAAKSTEKKVEAPAATTDAQPEETKPLAQPQRQQPAPAAEEEGLETIRSTVDRVSLIFTVTDKHGRFIKDLTVADLHLLDDNRPVDKIESFHAETNLPLRVGLLVDSSSSVRDRFRFEQEAAIEFLNQIIRPKVDKAFVLGFDSVQDVTQDFTDDQQKLAAGVRALRAGGGTALYDAVFNACKDKLAETSVKGPVRKAIILLSDGEDTWSRALREEALEQAQRAEVIIYAISTNTANMESKGDKVLAELARSTGGQVFHPYKLEEVSDAFREIQDELRSQYAMTYKPANLVSDGRFRSIFLEARNKSLRVRTRRGYYAPRPARAIGTVPTGAPASTPATKKK